ncbi:MAG: sulfatase, partial [Bacteroidota bacterium]
MNYSWARCFFLVIVCLSLLACEQPKPLPNILFIAVDDLKPLLGAYGDTSVISPNIDRIASEGVVFLNNHCQQALCGPTRASLLTGLYPDQIQVWGFKRQIREVSFPVVTIPQYFKEQGYHTVGISKIFDYRNVDSGKDSISWSEPHFPNSADPIEPYFPEATGPVVGYFYQSLLAKSKWDSLRQNDPKTTSSPDGYLHKIIKPACEALDLPDHAYKDGIFALRAIEDLKRLSQGNQPFFLAVGFERPHLPYTAPKRYWDLYNRDEIQLADYQQRAIDDLDFAYTNSGSIKSYTDEEGNFIYRKLGDGALLTDHEQRKLIHGYKASVSYIDVQVGKIIQQLEELQLRDHTIVVIWGDHGYHMYDHSIWGKSTNFEQATRSPLIITGGGISPRKIQVATEFTDLFPTLCELAGLDAPDHLSGESLVDLMRGKRDVVKGYAISQFQRGDLMGYAIRDDRFRYVEWVQEGRHVNALSQLDQVV